MATNDDNWKRTHNCLGFHSNLKMQLKNFKNFDVFSIFLLVRLLSVFMVQTFFVPDEYYQSLEVAHRLVFGYGHLTWEWHQGIRSYGYPLFFALLYKVLYILGLDSPQLVIYVPRIAQALLSAYSDLCFYRWSGTKKWAVFSICSSWFWFYTCSRTLINTFETSLTTIALSQFPWLGKGSETSTNFIWIAAGLFCIRATSAVIWLPMCLFHLCISQTKAVKFIRTKYIPIGFIVLTMSVILDSLIYGSFQITSYNFLKANILQDVATNYGTQPWHWYLSSGIPAILGIQILPFIMGVLVVLKARQNHLNELAMLGTVIFAILIFSLLPHKEFRFLLPLLPIMLFVSSRFLSAWSRKASCTSVWLATFIIFIGNLLPAYYVGYNHQRGTLDVMEELQHIALKDPENVSLLFLMPCHSTPLYSHIHINVKTRFLTCNPNLDGIQDYIDEADQFYAKPNSWLRQNYPPNSTLPSHIVCFDTLVPVIGNDILTRYKRIKQFFHCDFPLSSRIGANVLIHERKDFEILWTT